VISDNGRHFDSECYREFERQWEFEHITSSPHFPQSNGFIERTIQTVKNTLKKCNSVSDTDLAFLCLRTTPVSSTIPSPAELLYSRKLKSNLPAKLNNEHEYKDKVYEQFKKRQEKQKEYHDRTAHDLPQLYQQQPVYVQHHQTGLWEKGTIKEKREEPRSYNVTMPNGKSLRRNRKQIRERVVCADKPCEQNDDQPEDINVEIPIVSKNECDTAEATDSAALCPSPVVKSRSGRRVKKPERYCDELCVYESDFSD